MKTLKDTKVGETVKVVKLHGEELWIWALPKALRCISVR